MRADVAEAQPLTAEGTRATLRLCSSSCEMDVALTDEIVGDLREVITTCLKLWGLEDLDFRVTLAASELLANAYRHARPEGADFVPVKVLLTRTPDGVFLSVRDPHPHHPVPCTAGDDDEGGRGLALIKGLTDGYGCSSREHGKDVWVTVLRPSGEAASS